ncbi:cell envelope integrity protein TolA [Solimonas terrae]|uniref:Cell envelope integrity protein TolA n=1 Tax=Solimonas terrae TaxID=1396819 RepID=A0A6M2BQ81_9GAMM|nr:cell envelope integrity protein TolA [Solimonas terrae]NGY04233.1 cell envelope integrity protein TolA [Solimonas terrae]
MIERRYLVAAIGLHVVIFALMFASAFFHRKIVAPAPIEAVLIADSRPALAPRPTPPQPEPPQPPVEQTPPEPPKPVPPPPKPEPTEAQKLEQQKKKEALEEQKRQAETARKEKEAEIKADAERKKQEEQQRKAEAEQKRQEELRQKQEEEQRQKEIAAEQERIKREAEAAEAARRKAAMDAALAAEQAARIQAAQADWGQVMAARIRKFWIRSPTAPNDFSCTVAMQLMPDGQVQSAKVVSSCGDPQLDRSVEAAVIKASPMPLPPDPKAFVPNVTVNFTPHAG